MSRTLSITSSAALTPKLFSPVKLSGCESVNTLFDYHLILKTPDLGNVEIFNQFGIGAPNASVDLTAWLGQSVTVSVELDGKAITFSEVNNTFRQYFTEVVGKGIRYINGVITSAQYLYDEGRSSYYSIMVSPFLYAATLKSNYRIFQDKTVLEIIDELLIDYSGTVVKRLEEAKANRYPKRDYQTQFGETDFGFFNRLCAEWGICYYFEHTADGHTLSIYSSL